MEIISGFVDFVGNNFKEIAAGVAIILAIAGALVWLFCMSSAEVGILGGRISGEFQPQMMVLGCFGLSPYAA